MKLNHIFLLFLTLFLFAHCDPDEEEMEENVFEGCCDIPPLIVDLNPGYLIAPNIISPNGDGVNDGFRPFETSDNYFMSELKFFDSENVEVLSFVANGVDPFDFFIPFDTDGLFTYEITLTEIDGPSTTYSGSFCSYTCTNEHFEIREDCIYEQQIVQGAIDADTPPSLDSLISIPNFEREECF